MSWLSVALKSTKKLTGIPIDDILLYVLTNKLLKTDAYITYDKKVYTLGVKAVADLEAGDKDQGIN